MSQVAEPAGPPPSSEVTKLADRARAELEKRDLKSAEATYQEALKLAPDNLHLLSNLGVVQFQAKKYELAAETLRKALRTAPEDDFVHCTLGILYYSQGGLDVAIDELTYALTLNPKNATAHRYMSIVASEKGWVQAAQKHAEMAATLKATERDSTFQAPVVRTAPRGDFLTPLEKSRLEIPPGTYRHVQPPGGEAPRRQ